MTLQACLSRALPSSAEHDTRMVDAMIGERVCGGAMPAPRRQRGIHLVCEAGTCAVAAEHRYRLVAYHRAVFVAQEIHDIVTCSIEGGIGAREQMKIAAAMAIGAEHKMLAAEGAVELQVDRGRPFGDRQHIARGTEAELCTGRGEVGDVERVADRKAVDRQRVGRQIPRGRIRRPVCKRGEIEGRKISELRAQGDRRATALSAGEFQYVVDIVRDDLAVEHRTRVYDKRARRSAELHGIARSAMESCRATGNGARSGQTATVQKYARTTGAACRLADAAGAAGDTARIGERTR